MTTEPQPNRVRFERARRWIRILLGFSILLVGIIMIVTPGPAIVFIPLGLATLATEYAWARRYLQKFKDGGEKLGYIFFPRKPK
jgi:tellurite resistance protein TerC